MIIKDVLFSAGVTGFFFDDQAAIKKGAEHDGFIYKGEPITEGFKSIRIAGESISVMLIMENGQIAYGDCAAVQYSGAGGRDPLFLAEIYIPFLNEHIKPYLVGRNISSFKEEAEAFDILKINGERLHTAIRYGISQALLDAAAISAGLLKQEVVCRDYELPLLNEAVPLFAQTGDDRYTAVDKMIRKHIDVLPHALINNIDTKLGRKGELLLEYVHWLSSRVIKLRTDESYKPDIHIDVYGNIGTIFNYNAEKMAGYFLELEKAAGELQLYIEGPMDMGEKSTQIKAMKELRETLTAKGCKVKTVADEWCNTWEDIRDFTDARCCDMVQIKTPDLGSLHNVVKSILYCKEMGMEAYQGGTCNETDISAQTCVHVALAARADRMLVKPGMGFDEGLTIVKNEMERTLAVLRWKEGKK